MLMGFDFDFKINELKLCFTVGQGLRRTLSQTLHNNKAPCKEEQRRQTLKDMCSGCEILICDRIGYGIAKHMGPSP